MNILKILDKQTYRKALYLTAFPHQKMETQSFDSIQVAAFNINVSHS